MINWSGTGNIAIITNTSGNKAQLKANVRVKVFLRFILALNISNANSYYISPVITCCFFFIPKQSQKSGSVL